MLKHFIIATELPGDGSDPERRSGRYAVRLDGDQFQLVRLCGRAVHADQGVLCTVLDDVAPGWRDTHAALRAQRRNPFFVATRGGMSGSRDHLLRVVRSTILNNVPIVARIHVSMFGRLNEPVRMWLGDLLELLPCLPAGEATVWVEEVLMIDTMSIPDLIYPDTPIERHEDPQI